MDTTWIDRAAMDPTGIAVLAVVALIGAVASVVVLVRQADPRVPVDRARVARRREPTPRAAR